MSTELDARAARAMGWSELGGPFPNYWRWVSYGENSRSENSRRKVDWTPSTDRNDLAELIAEVGRRKMSGKLGLAVSNAFENSPEIHYAFFILTSDPAVICEAACEVLEADNG